MSQIVSEILFLVQLIVIARYLGISGLGGYSFVFAFGGIFFIFANLGLTDLVTREIARNRLETKRYLSNLISMKFFSSLIAATLMIFFLRFLTISEQLRIAIFLSLAVFILDSYLLIFFSIFRAYSKLSYEAIILLLQNTFIVFLGVSSLILGYGLIGVIAAFVGGKLIAFLISLYVIISRFAKPKFGFDFLLWRYLVINSLPFLVNTFFILMLYRIDLVMLQILDGIDSVGLFQAAYTIIRNLNIFPYFFAIAAYPTFSKLFIKNKIVLRHLYKKIFFFVFLFSFVLTVCIFLFSKPLILLLYGTKFSGSISILKLLSLGGFFLFLNSLNVYYLYSINKSMVNTYFFTIAIIINVLLNFILIPRFSYFGAGLATTICYAFIFFGENVYILLLNKKLKISNTLN